MTDQRSARLLTWALLAATLVGCGLKGPLTLPEKSTNVVIRGPGGTPAEGGARAPGEATAAPETPVAPAPKPAVPASRPASPADDHMPPPPLPGGTPGGPGG